MGNSWGGPTGIAYGLLTSGPPGPTFLEEKMEETMLNLKKLQQLPLPPWVASEVDEIIIRADAEFSALNGISDWNGSAISASRCGSVFDYGWWFR